MNTTSLEARICASLRTKRSASVVLAPVALLIGLLSFGGQARAEDVTIGFVAELDSFFDAAEDGARQAATDLGAELKVFRGQGRHDDGSLDQVEGIASFGPIDALIIRPDDEITCADLDSGLYTITLDSSNMLDACRLAYVGSSNLGIGEAGAEYLLDEGVFDRDDRAALILTLPRGWGIASTNDRADGFAHLVSQAGTNVSEIDFPTPYWFNPDAPCCELRDAVQQIRRTLADNDETALYSTSAHSVNAYFACVVNDCDLVTKCHGCRGRLDRADGLEPSANLAVDRTEATVRGVCEKDMVAFQEQDPYAMGYVAVERALDFLNGDVPTEPEDIIIDAQLVTRDDLTCGP